MTNYCFNKTVQSDVTSGHIVINDVKVRVNMQISHYRLHLVRKLDHKFHVYDYHFPTFLALSPPNWYTLSQHSRKPLCPGRSDVIVVKIEVSQC